MENLIKQFNDNKSLSNLQEIKNAGMRVLVLQNGNWENLTEFSDSFIDYHNAIGIYDKINGSIKLTGIGFFKNLN